MGFVSTLYSQAGLFYLPVTEGTKVVRARLEAVHFRKTESMRHKWHTQCLFASINASRYAKCTVCIFAFWNMLSNN